MAQRNGIRVIPNSVATRYAGPHERIVEFSAAAPDGNTLGGLISFRVREGGKRSELVIEIYRADLGVLVRAGGKLIPVHDPADVNDES